MSEPAETPAQAQRRRLINLGEIIALAALVISALGLWRSWSQKDQQAPIAVEKKTSIPLALRGKVADGGKQLAIAPVEAGHALETLTISVTGKPPLELGGDPNLAASAVEKLLPEGASKRGAGTLAISIDARYIEAGTDRRGGGLYRLGYSWIDGGLFGGHSLRLTGLTRG